MSDDLDRELKARFDRELAGVRPPLTWRLTRRSSPLRAAVTMGVVVAVLVGATAAGLALRAARESQSAAEPSTPPSLGSPTPSPSVTPSPTPTETTAGGLVTHENRIFGYRLSLPATYRRVSSSIITGQESLGHDRYTLLTPAEEREECDKDRGGIPSPATAAYLNMHVSRNVDRLSAVQWASASPVSTHHTVEPVMIDGREAARLVQQGKTSSYVMAANERIYLLSPDLWPTPHPLEEIAQSFRAIAPEPFPTSTAAPAQSPREAARELGQRLAQAFAAHDAEAVARLITSSCWLSVSALVEPVQPGTGACCVLNRAVGPFVQALRGHFSRGDLTVSVDPEVQTLVEGTGPSAVERFYMRSTWRDAFRSTPVDLFLSETQEGWRWVGARHHYQRAEVGTCVPYRSPWTLETASC